MIKPLAASMAKTAATLGTKITRATVDYTGGKLAYAAWVDAFDGVYVIQDPDGSQREGTFVDFDLQEARIKDAWQAVYDAVKASSVAPMKTIDVAPGT